MDEESDAEKNVGTDILDDAGRRDIIAEGMKRFEGIAKTAPSQARARAHANACMREMMRGSACARWLRQCHLYHACVTLVCSREANISPFFRNTHLRLACLCPHVAQPAVERLSPRVMCILGQNPSPYTLNGTNCYLVGTGARRVLIDTGDNPELGSWWRRNHVEFMRHLKNTLVQEKCELDMILVTHLHTGLSRASFSAIAYSHGIVASVHFFSPIAPSICSVRALSSPHEVTANSMEWWQFQK